MKELSLKHGNMKSPRVMTMFNYLENPAMQ